MLNNVTYAIGVLITVAAVMAAFTVMTVVV